MAKKIKNKMKIKKRATKKICLILNVFSDDKRQKENKSHLGISFFYFEKKIFVA